jgi:hypothetical protein
MVVIESLVERANFLSFLFGAGVYIFAGLAGLGGLLARATCSIGMYTALFGGAAVAGVAPCIAAGALSLLSGAVASGLYTYGTSQGWTFETIGDTLTPTNQKRADGTPYPKIVDTRFGVSHHYDPLTHKALNETYGAMLDKHNTTLLFVTWTQTLPNANHTTSPFANLNMTNGRLLHLNDNGVIRTAIGHKDSLDQIMVGFDDFKRDNGTTTQLKQERQDSLDVSWMSYTTLGENMAEASQYSQDIQEAEIDSSEQMDYGLDDVFSSDFFGGYAPKFCLSAGPPNTNAGQDSIIVGEVYVNQFGGLDTDCLSG